MSEREGSGMGERLGMLRAELARLGFDGFLVPRGDEHLGEYVPPSAERLVWLTGFTGSAGLAVVLAGRAAVFTDGRYTLQLAQEAGAEWERLHLTETPPPAWVAGAAPKGARVGYDPWLFSEAEVARYAAAGVTLVAVGANPVDAVWADRPAPPRAPAVPHPLAFAGVSSAEKRAAVAEALRAAGEDAAVLGDPASLAWLLNVRGGDVAFTPFALGFAVVHSDARVTLFMDGAKLGGEVRAWLGNEVELAEPAAMGAALAGLAGRRVRVDEQRTAAWFAQTLRAAGAVVVAGADPCALPKACKNAVEQAGARAAHLRDAVAVCRFLHWVEGRQQGETELSAAARLLALRGEVEGFRGESFPAITGAGEHGAVIHYRATAASDRAIGADEVYLIDSGGQYEDGTTDVTRTLWTGPGAAPDEVRERATRVLQGHIAIASLVFPRGVCGAHLDSFARRALWDVGLDYDHGTGHGVGSYLSVHEGPIGLSRAARPVAFEPGMVVSDEPGFYLPGAYGMRLENLLLVREADVGGGRFLRFETLTLAPFDRGLIAPGMLTAAEAAWLDAYHARVLAEVGPLLDAEARAWLAGACAPVAA
ncbi:MAG: aminopeptidase P family protein [Janthinobacterium lividum]